MAVGFDFSLSLRSARVEQRADTIVVITAFGEHGSVASSPGVHAALVRLASDGATEAALIELVRAQGRADELAALFYQLRLFDAAGQLVRTLVHEGDPLVSVIPLVGHRRVAPVESSLGSVELSRFAYLRRLDGALVLESPTTHTRVRIEDRRVAAVIHAVVEQGPVSVEQLAELGLLGPAPLEALLRTLLGTGHFVRGDDAREQQAPLATWSFHDLLFHARSRVGRNDAANGKTYPWLGKLDPLPATATPVGEATLELPRPNLDVLAAEEPSFTSVLESRRSIREHGEVPISLPALAEFLYRSARVIRLAPAAPPVHYEFSTRPSPGGGACHELELYLAVHRCDGLTSGLYHYDPLEHRLTRICGRTAELEALLADTAVATGGSEIAQVLVCIAARFARMSWSYEGIAYAATLKNVGALMQTMYLVATAMGLAPCSIGRGDADLFAAAAGTDYYAHTTVGEFILGSRRNSP
jgi:SagB-type dehydrogenase family enzyme